MLSNKFVPQRSPEWKKTFTDWRFRRRRAKGSSINISWIRILIAALPLMCSSYIVTCCGAGRRMTYCVSCKRSRGKRSVSPKRWAPPVRRGELSAFLSWIGEDKILPYRQSLHQAKEKIRDLEKDNVILRCECIYCHNKLFDSVLDKGKATRNF